MENSHEEKESRFNEDSKENWRNQSNELDFVVRYEPSFFADSLNRNMNIMLFDRDILWQQNDKAKPNNNWAIE